MFDRGISLSEASAIHSLGVDPQASGLVGYWSFDEPLGQVIPDLSGSGNDAFLGGSPTLVEALDAEFVPSTAPLCCDNRTADCNGNGISDACDIVEATSLDADNDGIPDECQTPWTDVGFAKTGVTGDPLLEGFGPLTGDSALVLTLSNAAPSATTALFLALQQVAVPFKGGTLVPFPPVATFTLGTDASGNLVIPSTSPTSVPPGLTLAMQYWIADGAATLGLAASNGLVGVTP